MNAARPSCAHPLLPLSVGLLVLHGLTASALGSDAGRLSRIIDVAVELDGSLTPPGDAITVTVVVAPGATRAYVEVQAYLVSGNNNERQEPVRGKTPQYRTEAGGFLASSLLMDNDLKRGGGVATTEPEPKPTTEPKHGGSRGFRKQVIIPYEELAVPKGEHRLGYTVSLVVDGEVVDFSRLPLNSLTVTDGVRTEIARPGNRERVETVVLPRDVLLMGASTIEQRTIQVPTQQTRMLTSTVTLNTTIPGGYERSPVYGQDDPTRSVDDFVAASKRTIYFATNRNEIGAGLPAARRFGNNSIAPDDRLTYGAYAVSIPLAVHERGKVEQPGRSWWFWKETPDPAKHFLVLEGDALSVPRLTAEELSSRLGGKDVLLYIHGFNNSFEDSLVRAAQMQHDLRFGGNMMVFSWPSEARLLFSGDFEIGNPANLLAYDADRKKASTSAPFLAEVLEHLLATVAKARPNAKVHVVAHSMGNYVLLNGLAAFQRAREGQAQSLPRLGEVVLAAPDVTDGEFFSLHSALFASSQRVTLYSSADDVALRVSQLKKNQRPVGLWPLVDPRNPLDTISADGAFSSFYDDGHSYFGNTIAILTDISFLLNLGRPPLDRRPPLGPRVEAPQLDGGFYWTVDPSYLP